MKNENRECKNCKKEFTVEAEDFSFYENLKVPAPTWCPECRLIRRLHFLNSRTLYKRSCELCGKGIIAMYAPEDSRPVYCPKCWWSDEWDPLEYGVDYDPSRPFLEQLAEMEKKVPHISLSVDHGTMVNSDYTNFVGHIKNCYLIFIADFCENVLYSNVLANDRDCMDCVMLGESELCYWNINCGKGYNLFFSEDSDECNNSYFLKGCVGCSDCFACTNLRNQKYQIFNEQYTKEEYERKLKEYNLGSWSELQALREKVYEFWKKEPVKFMLERQNANVSGDYVYYSKNARDCYQVRGLEDCRFCQIMTVQPSKGCYDVTEWGNNIQHSIEAVSAGEGANEIRYAAQAWPEVMDVEYSLWTLSSSHIFGCAGLRNREYCILNKQYSKEEFEALREKIRKDMDAKPYVDKHGRMYGYGEFFPPEIAPFAYNESDAMDFFPLSREEVENRGYRWREPDPSPHKPTIEGGDLPDDIQNVEDSILKEIVECTECKRAFRMVPAELSLLKRFGFPLHRKCPNCRHKERMARVNPPRLWERTCAKCGKDVKTSHDPEKKGVVYCKECYQEEFV